jgi:hypothetical protein
VGADQRLVEEVDRASTFDELRESGERYGKVIVLLKEKALEAKEESQSVSGDQRGFALGRLMAFHEVVSLMQQQAQAFGIPLEALGLEGIQPERDLV